jgi:cell division protein FtsW
MPKTTRTLVVVVLLLLALGLVMLASTSTVRGAASFGDAHYFLKRQAMWIVVALGVLALTSRFDYHRWQDEFVVAALAVVSVVALSLVFVPGIGARVGGSYRWLRLGPLSVQPSEFVKLSMIMVLSAWMARMRRHTGTFTWGLLFPMAGLGIVLGLLILEPDYGTTALTAAVGMLILYTGGTRFTHLLLTGVIGLSGFVLAIMRNPVRLGRIMAFVMPEKHPAAAHQLAQSKVAFVTGGAAGVGLGASMQKQFYLPEAHTDFIFAIVGEELGFFATGGVVVLFLVFLVCGILIAARAKDTFGRLLAFGITSLIVMQAVINIGVVAGCLPTKGLPLPFISYGGSSMVVSMGCLGVLLNVARHVDPGYEDKHTRVIKDRAHRF